MHQDCHIPDTDAYAWGHNGQLKDNEIYGQGNTYSAEYWEYDARLMRRWNTDPIEYEWQSPYACFNNNPVYYADPLGLEGTNGGGNKKPKDRGKGGGKGRKKNSDGTIPVEEGDDKGAPGSTAPNGGTYDTGGGASGGEAYCPNCGPNGEPTYGIPDPKQPDRQYTREEWNTYYTVWFDEGVLNSDGNGGYWYWQRPPAQINEKAIDFALFKETVQRDHLPMLKVCEYLLEGTAGFLVPGGTMATRVSAGSRFLNFSPKIAKAIFRNMGKSVILTEEVAVTPMTSIAVKSALANRIGKKGFSEVGYQFQKHAGRKGGTLWNKALSQGTKLNPATYNQAGYNTFKEIWRAPGSFQKVGGFIEKRLPDGRGIRLQQNWQFKGFID